MSIIKLTLNFTTLNNLVKTNLPNVYIGVINRIGDDDLISERIQSEVGILPIIIGHDEGVVSCQFSTLETFSGTGSKIVKN